MSKMLRRYSDGERMNHWLIAIAFFLAGLSGLVFFHPSFYFLSNLFGGGVWARILHPFIGVFMFLCFLVLFFKLWKQNLINATDREWRKQAGQMLRGNKENLPPAGKYNYGQKVVFWLMALSLIVLLLTGLAFWRPWFAPYFPIGALRLAVLLHSISAVVLILSVIVHIYAAIWVKGTMRAMTRGDVSEGWARLNHPLWHKEVTKGR
jgi:formate dehydrogenase subunit gamma